MRAGRRLVEDFLLPALNDQRYGDLLKWEDKEKLHFSIRWSHKNAAKWSLSDTQVFQDWDRMKGHFHPEVKGYYMQAKQRFRAALYKLNTVKKLKSEDKHVKKYQLVDKYQFMLENSKKRQEKQIAYGTVLKEPVIDESQKFIPTAVICWNDGHADRVPEQAVPQWQSPYVLPKVPEPPVLSYSIPNGHSSYREVPGCRSSPLLQENHVTSVQDQHFVKVEPEACRTSPSGFLSSPIHSTRNIPDCSHDARMDCSREFFAQLNLVEKNNSRTNSDEDVFQSSKKLCVPSDEPTLTRSPRRELDTHSYEVPDVQLTEIKQESPNSPCGEFGSKDLSAKSAQDSSGLVSVNGNHVSSEVIAAVDPAACVAKSRKENVSQRRHLADALRKTSGSPHVPIPPLPGYSKSSVVPRRNDSQHNAFLIRDHLVTPKTKPSMLNNSNAVWHKANSIPTVVDGPLNLSTKPDHHYKSESPTFADR